MQTILDMEPVDGPPPKRPRGRVWRVVAVVLALHAVAFGVFAVFQGCHRSEPSTHAEENATPPSSPENTTPAPDAAQGGGSQPAPVAQPGGTALTPEERIPGGGAPPSMPASPPEVVSAPPAPSMPTAPAVAPKAGKPSGSSATYTVRKGDTLSKVARHYTVSIRELAELNRMPADASLKVGQKLAVPAKKAGAEPSRSATPPKASVAKASPGTTHVVKSGETLTAIAKQHGVTVDALMRANDITDPAKLKVGQKLKIPAAHAAPSSPSNTSLEPHHGARKLAA